MYHSCCAETKLTCFHPLLLSFTVLLRNEFFPPCLTFPCLLSVVESSCAKAPSPCFVRFCDNWDEMKQLLLKIPLNFFFVCYYSIE